MNSWKSNEETVEIQNTEPPNRMKNTKSRTGAPGEFKKGGTRSNEEGINVGGQYKKD